MTGTGGVEDPHVSKSVFYTGQTSSSALQTEDNLIETRLVPSSVKSIQLNKEKNIVCSLCDYTTHAKYYLNEHFRYVHLKVKVICGQYLLSLYLASYIFISL